MRLASRGRDGGGLALDHAARADQLERAPFGGGAPAPRRGASGRARRRPSRCAPRPSPRPRARSAPRAPRAGSRPAAWPGRARPAGARRRRTRPSRSARAAGRRSGGRGVGVRRSAAARGVWSEKGLRVVLNWTSGKANSEYDPHRDAAIGPNPERAHRSLFSTQTRRGHPMRLKGKTALVTAAGQGIGHASALALAAEGAQVWATDVNEKLLERYAGVANIQAARLDVLDKAAIEAFTKGLPALDILFNCAGVVHNGAALQATDDDLDFAFRLNVRAQFWLIQAVLPGMLAAGRGSIINMASVCSQHQGPAQPLRLRHHQGGSAGAHQERRGRLRGPGHPLQCGVPRHGRHALAGRPHQRQRRPGGGTQGLHRAPADGPARAGRGDRAAGGVPRQRRIACSSPARPMRPTAASPYEPARLRRPARGRHRRRDRAGLRHRAAAASPPAAASRLWDRDSEAVAKAAWSLGAKAFALDGRRVAAALGGQGRGRHARAGASASTHWSTAPASPGPTPSCGTTRWTPGAR